MFQNRFSSQRQSGEDWQSVPLDSKQKLFRVSQFLFMSGGRNYNIEVQQGTDGRFTAHAENTSDAHDAIAPSHGASLKACLSNMVAEITKRGSV